MNYIMLGRQLDTMARQSGYANAPDDVLGLVLKFTGNIELKATGIYNITANIKYDRWRYTILIAGNVPGNVRWDLYRANIYTYISYDYCSHCDRCYANIKTHIQSDKHNNNKHRKSKDDRISEIIKEHFLRSCYGYGSSEARNIRIECYSIKEMWEDKHNRLVEDG